jgi:hypothetical protein
VRRIGVRGYRVRHEMSSFPGTSVQAAARERVAMYVPTLDAATRGAVAEAESRSQPGWRGTGPAEWGVGRDASE